MDSKWNPVTLLPVMMVYRSVAVWRVLVGRWSSSVWRHAVSGLEIGNGRGARDVFLVVMIVVSHRHQLMSSTNFSFNLI